jgi:hypothetical protein
VANQPSGSLEVSVPDGRWGPRRARVSECHCVLDARVLQVAGVEAGRTYRLLVEGRWDLTWVAGSRARFVCGCGRRAVFLYVPAEGCWPKCRTCYGLSYASRARSYRASQRTARSGAPGTGKC